MTNAEKYDEKSKIIELFNKYDILLVHLNGKIVPVKNSTKQECYNLLYEIQELIEWRKILFKKNLRSIEMTKEELIKQLEDLKNNLQEDLAQCNAKHDILVKQIAELNSLITKAKE